MESRAFLIMLVSFVLLLGSGCASVAHLNINDAESGTPFIDIATIAESSFPNTTEKDTPNSQKQIFNTGFADVFAVEEGYRIVDYAEIFGTEFNFEVYKISSIDEDFDGIDLYFLENPIYWLVIVLRDNEFFQLLRLDFEDVGMPYPDASLLVLEADVNFDTANDILLWLGHFGAQGAIRYKCYLQTDDGFTTCQSFSDIANPGVDKENKAILSSWRNMAVSHSWAVYKYIDGEFIEVERLTEEPASWGENEKNIVWSWTEEVWMDGKWQVREYFTENDYDEETLYNEKVYGETAYWDIGSDRWRTLFNNGKMSDFSIYSSEWVENE